MKQKIIPHIWYEKGAFDAASFYVDVFGKNSEISSKNVLHNTPSGDVDTVSFNILGFEFVAISAGPLFKINQSISFIVNFDPSQQKNAEKNLDRVWEKLSVNGKELMPLQKYNFSEHYGWIQDKFGVSWQLILTNPEGEERPVIIPSLLFVNKAYGNAEDASEFYISIFKNSPTKNPGLTKRGAIFRYPKGVEPDKEGAIMFSDFMLEGQWFAAMDSAQNHDFNFNEAISFMVLCKNQDEIDHFWNNLTAHPESEQCGWLKDKYGVSWQIIPEGMEKMMQDKNHEKVDRVTQTFLKMKKINISELDKAANA